MALSWIIPWKCQQTLVSDVEYTFRNFDSGKHVQFTYFPESPSGEVTTKQPCIQLTAGVSGYHRPRIDGQTYGKDGECSEFTLIFPPINDQVKFRVARPGILLRRELNKPHHLSGHREGDRLRISILYEHLQPECCGPYKLVRKTKPFEHGHLCGMNEGDYEYQTWLDAIDSYTSGDVVKTTWLVKSPSNCSFEPFNNTYDSTLPPTTLAPTFFNDHVNVSESDGESAWIISIKVMFILVALVTLCTVLAMRRKRSHMPIVSVHVNQNV